MKSDILIVMNCWYFWLSLLNIIGGFLFCHLCVCVWVFIFQSSLKHLILKTFSEFFSQNFLKIRLFSFTCQRASSIYFLQFVLLDFKQINLNSEPVQHLSNLLSLKNLSFTVPFLVSSRKSYCKQEMFALLIIKS